MRLRRANQPNGYASGGLVPDIHPPTPSHLSHTKRSASHTHLGLRPKASDSLHTKIRSSNPQPKHISQIENVVSSAVQAVGGGDVGDVARRKKRELKRGNSMHSNDTSHDTSRAVSPHESQEASTSDTDEKQHPYEDDLETTDIGIYHNDVYDEYLSSTMGKLRKLLVKSLEWESPILAKHQVRPCICGGLRQPTVIFAECCTHSTFGSLLRLHLANGIAFFFSHLPSHDILAY